MTVASTDSDPPRNQVIDLIELYRRIWARQQDCWSRRAERTRRTEARWKCKARHGLPQIIARISTEPGASGKPVEFEGAVTL
ncbi:MULTISPECIES: hypothetical protein [Rhizobium]|uniref:hypothetical protein n=1 Tax=Rhizobium TaxID=379 RepID=UPI001C837383|nr:MULTISPECIES: hypothetical protein [Rhizobium]MBX4925719.1 hypothetical protein [Rhizobium binae]